jgi:hypothetical protein
MNSMDKIPLNYEASEGDTHKKLTTSLPQEVVQCLENARFVSLRESDPCVMDGCTTEWLSLTRVRAAASCDMLR